MRIVYSVINSWKSLFLTGLICLLAAASFAQTNIANYRFSSGTSTYTPLTGATVLWTTWDSDVSAALPLGGTFNFGGASFTTCFVSANGAITFGASSSSSTILSTLGSTTGAVAAWVNDGSNSTATGATPSVSYMNIGGATGEFVVQFEDHARWANRSTERLNFQIRLNLATGEIKVVYGSFTPSGTSATTSQVGIRGNSTTFSSNVNNLMLLDVPSGTTCNWADAVTGTANSSTMLYTSANPNMSIPTGLTYTWTPQAAPAPVRTFSAVAGITSSSATISWTAPTGATQYNVQYRSIGSCAWTNFSGNPVAGNTATITGLTPVTTYQVRVQSSNGTNNAIWSHIPNAAGTGSGYATAGTFTTLGIATDLQALQLQTPALNANNCYGGNETVTIRIKNAGTGAIDFATNNATVSASVSGTNATTFTPVVLSTGTLAAGATQDVVVSSGYNMLAPGTYTFNANVILATPDANSSNDNIAPTSHTTIAGTTLPHTVDFTGFTGSNLTTVFPAWSEALGATLPSGTTSDWTSFTWPDGNTTSKINLDAASEIDWMVGPKFIATSSSVLKFDVAITNFGNSDPDPDGMNGTDDKVILRVSTDCGVTFTDFYTFSAANTSSITNTLTPQSIDLSAFAGQQIIIAFFASEGTVNDLPDYDFHIDNILLYNASPVDLGAIGLAFPLTPPGTGCFSATEAVQVTIKNYGSGTINFASTPVTVTTNVTGAATTTLSGTLNTGTLAPDETIIVSMGSPLNMTAAGTYTFNASTSIAGDGGSWNDAMVAATRINDPIVTLPITNDFTGFTGSNLNTVFTDWKEGSGETVPTGTTSSWTSSTVFTTSGTTAKINLLGTAKREWIVGPKFTATAQSKLGFKVAITDAASASADPDGMTGTDDAVIVRVSTDCGATFTDLYTFNAANTTGVISNTLVDQTVDLATYAGQTILIAFFATEGTVNDAPSYDFHIDDVNIYNATTTDMGAIALEAPVSPATGCYTATETVTVTIKNFGSGAIDFATKPVTVTTNVTGAVTATLTATVNTGSLAPDGTMSVNMSTTLDMTAGGTYTFNASTAVSGDGDATNDAMTAATRVVDPVVSLPQTVDFTGFTGSNLATVFPNWREGSGVTLPAGTTSTWTSSTVFTANGTTAKINLDAASDNAWLVGPKFQATAQSRLRFKVAITNFASGAADPDGMTGTDDAVIVRVSTDCGTTYNDLYTFNASNTGSLTNVLELQTIDLSAYAGQQITIAFFATEGTVNDAPDYDFHIDDINIENPSPVDVGAIGITAPVPPGAACYTATEPVTVTIKNYGTSTLDFSATPVTVTTNVTGAATATLTGTLNTGTLAPDETTTVTMSATLDMTASGTYTFNASTAITGDGVAANNAMASVDRINVAPVSLPQTVDFTGFTGTNLTTVFPNWNEATGATAPTGTTSGWTNQASWSNGNTTAKINLFAASKNDWLVGPKFVAAANSRLKFDVAITDFASVNAVDANGGMSNGTDDKVIVKISTDCGATFTDLYTFDATNTSGISNTLVSQSINLGTYAGQNVIIAFFATEGTVNDLPDYDFHIDNINIYNVPPVDAGAKELVAPMAKNCYSATETVTVKVENTGTGALDFAATPLTVTTNVTGAVTATLTATVNTGTLAPGATLDVPMSTTLDMTTNGTYTFNASTTLTGDGDASNNAMLAVSRVVTALAAGTITSSSSGFCVSGTPTLTLTGSTGGDIQWQSSTSSATGPWTNVGTNTATYTPASAITTTTYYQAVVTCGTNTVTATAFTVNVTSPQITGTTPASRCGAGTVTLGATASSGASVKWYTASSGGTQVGAGTSFITPSINATTTYYAAALIPGTSGSVGAPNTAISTSIDDQTTTTSGINFDVLSSSGVTINSVDIYPTDPVGSPFTIRVANGTTTVATFSGVTTVSGTLAAPVAQTVPLNMFITSGTGYRMTLTTNPNTIRNDGGDAFPYTLAGVISLTSSTLSGYYYNFYNWQVSSDCENPSRTAVVATVNNTITGSTSLAGTAGGAQVCASQDVAASVNYFDNCNIIATVTPSGALPVSGTVNACVKVESAVPTAAGTNEPYVARHYNIIPATNAATATATITLYFLQSEFDAFNAARGFYAALPTGAADNAGKVNLRVSMFPGSVTTPGTAGGLQIDPAEADINFADGRWSVSFPVIGSGSYFVHTGSFTLPVTLINFRGEQSGSTNMLLWSTSTETNNRGFELERSSDGRNYSSISFVASKAENGNSTSTLNYSYNDVRPLAGNNYYRLKQIDKDGKTTISNVVLLSRKISDITLSSVYPNPTTRELNLVISSPKAEKVTMVVTDLTGKVLMQRAAQLIVGDNQELFNVQQLAAGTYFIKAVCANGCETATQRFVKH